MCCLVISPFCNVCRLKAYIIVFTFRTISGISPANHSRSGPKSVHMQVKGRQRSRNFGRDRLSGGEMGGGAQKYPRRRVFLSAIRDDFSATSQRPIFAKFAHDTWIVVEKQILERNLGKVSIQKSFAPKTPNLEESNRRLTQSRLQVKGCTAERYCLLHVVVQRPGSFRGPVNFFCTTYGCGATGRQNCPIFGFWSIFPIQNA